MSQDVLARIATKTSGFSKGQRRTATYLTEHFERAAFMTAHKLGETVGVSESTIVRFACELGYEGYPEMQEALQELVRIRLTSAQRMEVSEEQLGEQNILQRVFAMDIERIRSTAQFIDPEVFQRAVHSIAAARGIFIVGIRSASILARFLYFYLAPIFEQIRLVDSSGVGELVEQLCHIGPGDVLIAITFPRYSRRTAHAVQYAKAAGAQIIGITDGGHSPIAPYCDELLCARSDMVSFADSLVAPLSLINAVIAAVGLAKRDDASTAYQKLECFWEEYGVYNSSEGGGG